MSNTSDAKLLISVWGRSLSDSSSQVGFVYSLIFLRLDLARSIVHVLNTDT